LLYALSNGARAVAPFASAATALLPGGYTALLFSLIGLSVMAALLGILALGGMNSGVATIDERVQIP